jgi:hypothetical protein
MSATATATATATEMVMISAARLAELEALAAVAREVKTKQAERLASVVERYKQTPERVLARVKRYQNKDREAYNARRRELRRLKKEAAAATPGDSPGASESTE